MTRLSFSAFIGFVSVSLPVSASLPQHIPPKEIMNALIYIGQEKGGDFCQSDPFCRDGMEMALSQTHAYFVAEQTNKSIPTMKVIIALATAGLQAKAICKTNYASQTKRQRCHNGAQAAVSLIATELGINPATPPLQPQIVSGKAYGGYEKYNACLRICAKQTPPPPKGCAVHCKDEFDLKAFLKSLPQLK